MASTQAGGSLSPEKISAGAIFVGGLAMHGTLWLIERGYWDVPAQMLPWIANAVVVAYVIAALLAAHLSWRWLLGRGWSLLVASATVIFVTVLIAWGAITLFLPAAKSARKVVDIALPTPLATGPAIPVPPKPKISTKESSSNLLRKAGNEKRKAAAIQQIIILTAQGVAINKAFWDTNNTEALKAASTDWGNKVIEFLTPINPTYGLRFAAATGERVVADTTNHDIEGSNLFNNNVAKREVLVAIAIEIDRNAPIALLKSEASKAPISPVITAPGDIQKKIDLLDRARILSDESVKSTQKLSAASGDWRKQIVVDRPALSKALQDEFIACRNTENKFIAFQHDAEVFDDIRNLANGSCYEYGEKLLAASKIIKDLGDSTGGNPSGLFAESGAKLDEERGKYIERIAKIGTDALAMRKKLSR